MTELDRLTEIPRSGARKRCRGLVLVLLLCASPVGGLAAHAEVPADAPATPAEDTAPVPSVQVFGEPLLPSWSSRLQLVVSRHPQVQAAASEVRQQESQIDLVRSGWMPQVRAGLSAGRAQSGSNAQRGSLSASQLLYDFGRLDGRVNEALAVREQRRARLLQAVDDSALEAASVLLDLERQSALSLEARRLVDALDEVVRLTRLRAQAGAATQVDPTIAQARRDGAVLTELGIRSRLEQSAARWRALSGDTSTGLGPQAGSWPLDLQATPLDALAAPVDPRDFDQAPPLLQAQRELDAARAALEVAKVQRLPSVTLDASAGRPLDRSTQPVNRSDTSLTVNLNAPIYQGGSAEAQVRSAVAAMEAAQARQDAALRTVSDRWRDAELQLQGALGRMPALQQRLLRYSDSRRLYREQYLQLGSRSILDFLNAEQELYLSRTELLNAEYDARLSKLQALHASGRLRAAFELRIPFDETPPARP